MYLKGKHIVLLAVAIVAAGFMLTGCDLGSDNANQHDVDNVKWQTPPALEVWANVDDHPNVAVLCIHGVAFVTTSRTAGNNFMRVPEFDVSVCHGTPSPYAPRIQGPTTDVQPTPGG